MGSSITSDLELSLMFYAKKGYVANFNQLLVAKPTPGQYVAGKGGNSALFPREEACTEYVLLCFCACLS